MTFDPDTFMSQTVDAPMDTIDWLPPEGDHKAMLDDFDKQAFRQFQSKDGSKDFTVFSPPFVLQDPAITADSGREKVVVYHKGIFIDFDEFGGIATGKNQNTELGRLREAVNQNATPGWNFGMLKGAGPVMVRVKHESDEKNPTRKYARVTAVLKLS